MAKIAIVVLSFCSIALAAPDEQKLGRDVGNPLGAAARKSFVNDESMRVGSFTHCGEIVRLHDGKANTLKHAESLMLFLTQRHRFGRVADNLPPAAVQ